MEEENVVHKSRPFLAPSCRQIDGQTKKSPFGGSLDDTECHQSKENLSNGNSHNPSKTGRNIPRRHTVGGPRSSKEILGMQTSDMDRKREAFLEHLKYKYPHHATAIMGHQERLRDQTKSPNLSSSPQPSLGEPAEHLSEVSADSGEAMFEGESTAPFVRGSRTRASLPVVRSTNQTKERSLGVLFLQYGEDTKKFQMPNEITSLDTIRALFVSAFPQQLTMNVLESPSTAIYIKDEGRNIYYELSDVRSIQDRSFLKVYNKDPAHAFNHTPRTVNGDVRMQREIAYNVREGPVVHRPGSATYPSHGGPISPPPTPVPHSMPPSPSRIPYGGGRPPVGQTNTTMPRERLSSLPVSRSISPSPSAILERRDVKPDEDMGNKNLQLMRNDSMYTDPYMYHEGRMSIASSHGGHPLDMPDHLIAFHRGSMRSSSTYSNTSMQVEMMEQSVYRQKNRKHSESHLPALGSKTPPASPHRVTDIRMMEMHGHNPHGPPHGIHSERSSPIRQSFKKDQGPGVFVEAKVRNTGGILGMADIVPSPAEKQMYAGYGAPKDNYTRERMHAMEKQIASLTGLVQNALFKGPSPSSSKDAPGEKVLKSASNTPPVTDSPGHSVSSGKNSLTIIETKAVISQVPPAGSSDMQVSLHDMRRNVAELRLQLQKMRKLQLQNQEMVRAMMKKAEQEISSKVTEMVKNLEDPVQRQRVLVEQERQKYLQDEEQIILKLSDLEGFVEDMKKDSSATRLVTLKDVEDRAFLLRQIGEAVSNLKGEFPYLQNKMRAVLRVEVEAVRFLKEEPHKLDSLLKRIRNMTDALSALRRHASEGSSKTVDYNQNNQYTITEKVTETETIQNKEEKSQVYLQQAQTEPGSTTEAQTTSVKSEVVPLSVGVKVHHVQSSPVLMQQSQHSSALVNHTFNSSNQSGHLADSSANHQSINSSASSEQTPTAQPTHVNGSSALFIEEIQHVGYRNRAVSIEEAERKFEEKRQNLDHYNRKEFEKMLEEAQANIMKSIPSLEVPSQTSKTESIDKAEANEGGQESEQENDKLTKSPPPPPPRRMYPLGSGLSSSWTSDWKDSKDSEDVPPPPPPKTIKPEIESPIKTSQVKDEEEEEGERIMAELQAFQKCSVVEINSKVQYELPKTEVQERDFRPSGLALPKEKKVPCNISKESVSPESPKVVESTEDKWKIQSISSPAPDSAQFSQVEKVVVNEQSTYSLFIGRDEPSSTDREESVKKSKNEELANMTVYNFHNNENLKHLSSTMPEVVNGGTDHKISETSSTFVKAFNVERQDSSVSSSPTQEQGLPYLDLGQTVVLRQKNSRRTTSQQSEDLESPAVSPTEPRSPADNIAFMITNTEVQVLSKGEVQDIVNRKGGEVQTVNVDKENVKTIPSHNLDTQDSVVCTDKKPVIIIFDEPMDIRAAYKRLSTIFEECDDDLEKMMSEAKIDEEEEEEEEEDKELSVHLPEEERVEESKMVNNTQNVSKSNKYRFNYPSLSEMKQTKFQDHVSQGFLPDEEKTDASDYQYGQRQDVKKKFKFKFPKKQLAALTQAIRTGTKTGKKTLQVVVYEDEEEPDGTVKQHKEAKRFEIERSKSREEASQPETLNLEEQEHVSRTDEIRQNTYRTLDSLEQTIKQLENTISGMTPRPGSDLIESRDDNKTLTITSLVSKGSVLADNTKPVLESPSSIPTTARKGSNGAPQTSRMPVPMSSKTRQGSMEKTSKQPKLQEPQRQFRQANGGTKKAGGDIKAASPTLSASKIPALSPNTGKSSSVSAQCNDTSNSHNPPVKSHVPVTNSNSQTARTVNAPSLIRPVHNGTSKLQSPTYSGKGHHLSFSLQNANGRPSPPTSSSSSATSPSTSVSPTSLTQGMKSIRTIHTPSFTSYKSQNGSATKLATPKDSS